MLVNTQTKTDTEYVRVPVTDPEGEAYREAARRLVGLTPALATYMEQLEAVKSELLRGQQISQKIGG